ncbi:MAG: hypothetical protein ACOC26_04750 [Halochromatium sp.]
MFDLPVERVKMASTDDAQSDGGAAGGLWPPADYQAQVERLRAAIGERIYLAELRETEVQLGVQLTDRAYELLDVIDFPRPDPARGLTPHLILLDDGRGLNLGRIARISRRPFQPTADELLYLDRAADQNLLFAARRLSPRFIAERAQALLGQVLGRSTPLPQSRLESAPAPASSASDAEASSSRGEGY